LIGGVEVSEVYEVKFSSKFLALENLHDDVSISRAWESIGYNIKTSLRDRLGYFDLKLIIPWFDEEYRIIE
jgi:hypothetical protein